MKKNHPIRLAIVLILTIFTLLATGCTNNSGSGNTEDPPELNPAEQFLKKFPEIEKHAIKAGIDFFWGSNTFRIDDPCPYRVIGKVKHDDGKTRPINTMVYLFNQTEAGDEIDWREIFRHDSVEIISNYLTGNENGFTLWIRVVGEYGCGEEAVIIFSGQLLENGNLLVKVLMVNTNEDPTDCVKDPGYWYYGCLKFLRQDKPCKLPEETNYARKLDNAPDTGHFLFK